MATLPPTTSNPPSPPRTPSSAYFFTRARSPDPGASSSRPLSVRSMARTRSASATRLAGRDTNNNNGSPSAPSSAQHTPAASPPLSPVPGPSHEHDASDDVATTSEAESSSRLSFAYSEGDAEFADFELEDEDAAAAEPLVSSRRRRRAKWDDSPGDRGLFELVAPLILAHPLALYPALSGVPTAFLPAGVALFVPLFCIIAALSACAHIVIVYLAWYLKVPTFEDVFAACAGERFGKHAAVVGRGFVLVATVGSTVGWLGSLFALVQPLATTYLPDGVLQSRLLWTIVGSLLILPAVVPSRTFRSLRGTPIVLALLLPIVTFIAIGRTVEVHKASEEAGEAMVTAASAAAAAVEEATADGAKDLARRGIELASRGLRGLVSSNAGSGITMLTMFFTPHLQTLPIHSSLTRAQRQKFGIPALAAGIIIVLLSLPLALVPYYLLPEGPTVFAQLPADDAWANVARVLMAAIVLGSITTWLLRGRDTILSALDVDRGERLKAARWVGVAMWAVVLALACIGGWVDDKIELLGVMATIAVGWLLPSVFFIITFHVRSPLAIILSSNAPVAAVEEDAGPSSPNGHIRTASLTDPSTDDLLHRKERQLQKRRLGRRLWQDLIVYVGILPVGCVTLAWCVGSFVGLW